MRNEKFKDLIFYEIYPTSFYDSNNDGIGDLPGITEKLDYVKETGFNAIWLNPFFVSPFKDGGYDVKDFFDVDPKFGTLKDFDELITKAHKLGIKIIIDLVAGHASEENKEFLRSGEAKRNEYSDLFIWNDNIWSWEPNYRVIAGRHDRAAAYMVNFFSVQPAFNYGFKEITNPKWQMSYKDPRTFQAREYITNVIRFWLNRGADGFRVDMADSLVKNDEDKSATIEVWNDIFAKVRKEFPDTFFVSEWSYPERSFKAGFDCDFVLDHWDNFYHRFIRSNEFSRGPSVLDGADFDFFMKDLKWRYEQSINNPGYLGIISGNHDGSRLANYTTPEKLRLFYLMQFSLPGIPFVYYGDEIEMHFEDLDSKDGGYQRTGCRTPMQWDHSKNDGFSKAEADKLYLPVNHASNITLEDNLKNRNSLYFFIKNLIQIRKDNLELQEKEMTFAENNRVLTINRGKISTIINLSKNDVNFSGKILISTGKGNVLKPNQGAMIRK